MTKNLDQEGIRSIADNYQLFYIDLWGVIHNGVSLHHNAVLVLKELSLKNKEYILLTNAPRPNNTVKTYLEKMGLEKEIQEHVFTSGEAALNYLRKNFISQNFYHIGPPRDFDLFQEFKKMKSNNIDSCDYILCTGLFDTEDKNLNFYKNLLEKKIHKKMICTNPDLIVDRGNVRELCAGSVAMIFEKMGGKAIYFGKPYPEVYNQSINNKNKKILCIGDNLNTDIKGANFLDYDSLLVTQGIHKDEIKKNDIEKVCKDYEAICNYTQSELKW
jgi:HAD superfamily hydrolase (TIGR01459 family)